MFQDGLYGRTIDVQPDIIIFPREKLFYVFLKNYAFFKLIFTSESASLHHSYLDVKVDSDHISHEIPKRTFLFVLHKMGIVIDIKICNLF